MNIEKMIYKYQSEVTATGYKGLDGLFNGGIRKGLYLLKGDKNNDFAHQLITTLAFNSIDIKYPSKKINADDLMNKALTRHNYLRTGEIKKIDFYNMKKTWDIKEIQNTYMVLANEHLEFYFNVKDIEDVYDIINYIEFFNFFRIERPIILVDSILFDDKSKNRKIDVIKKNIIELKRTCERNNIPIIISLTNEFINEYYIYSKSQTKNNNEELFDSIIELNETNENIKENRKEIELTISNNQFGSNKDKLKLDYYPEVYYYDFK